MKKFLSIIFILALPLSSNAEELFIYNWSDYIAEDTIANFEAEYADRAGKPLYPAMDEIPTTVP